MYVHISLVFIYNFGHKYTQNIEGYELMDLGLVNLINTDVGKPYSSDS